MANPKRLFCLCVNLLSACTVADLSRPRITYRVERHADYLVMRQAGETISFTSTSTRGFLPEYGDRIGIALLEFHIHAGVPCLPYRELLKDDYAKANEQEITLPPGLPLLFRDVPTQKTTHLIVDAQGNPPLATCVVEVEQTSFLANSIAPPAPTINFHAVHMRQLATKTDPVTSSAEPTAHIGQQGGSEESPNQDRDIAAHDAQTPLSAFGAEGPAAAARVYAALNSAAEPESESVDTYCAWKRAFRQALLDEPAHQALDFCHLNSKREFPSDSASEQAPPHKPNH